MSDRRYRCRVCGYDNRGPVDPTLSPSVVLGYCVGCKKRTPAEDRGPADEAPDAAARRIFAEDLVDQEPIRRGSDALREITATVERALTDSDDRVQAAYLEWRRTPDGTAVIEAIRRRAVELRRRGWRRYGIQALAEVVRFDRALSVGPDAAGYKVNNSHLSRLARDLMDEDPDLGGFFEIRELRSDGAGGQE